MSLSTAMTVVVLHLHFKGEHHNKLPRWVKKIAFKGLSHVNIELTDTQAYLVAGGLALIVAIAGALLLRS